MLGFKEGFTATAMCTLHFLIECGVIGLFDVCVV